MKCRKAFAIVLFLVVVLCSSCRLWGETVSPEEPTAPGGFSTPIEGEIRVTVVPVWLPDNPPVTPLENLSRLVFQNLSAYFYNQSYGKVWLNGSVLDWVQVPCNTSYYARGSLLSSNVTIANNASLGVELFRRDALTRVAWTKSNFTKQVMLVYSGSSTIHSHHTVESVLVDGTSTGAEVSVVPELYSLSIMAHELAHGFGLDDIYSKDPDRLESYMSSWDLMDAQGYGSSINDMSAYSKMRLGWVRQDEIADITHDTSSQLLGLNVWGSGTRVLRIRLGAWRFYLVEARTNRGDYSGVLVSRVDCSRNVRGYGRVEVVRSFRGIDPYLNGPPTFRPGEEYVDDEYNIIIRVLGQTPTGYTVQVRFVAVSPVVSSQDFGTDQILRTTSATHQNGTVFIALCTLNSTTNKRTVSLYRLNGRMERIVGLPSDNDTFNPVVVVNDKQVMLIFESAYGGASHVLAWLEGDILHISKGDDAHNPTAYAYFSGLYVAYENRTSLEDSIVVLATSDYGWSNSSSFQPEPMATVRPNENGTPTLPTLEHGNNAFTMSFLRTRHGKSVLEFKWDINSPNSSERFDQDGILGYHIDMLDEIDMFLMVEKSSSRGDITDLYFLTPFTPSLTQIGMLPYVPIGSTCLMGYWVAYQIGDTLCINQAWDSYRRQGETFRTALDMSRLVAFGLCSANGTAGLFALSSRNGSLEVRIWYESGLAAGAESPAYVAISVFVVEMFAGSMICLVLTGEYDQRLRSRLRHLSSWARASK